MSETPVTTRRLAFVALGVLTLINLLNYLDRYVVSGFLPLLKAEFNKSDAELGVLSSSFLVVYSLASPLTGLLGDRFPRKWFIGSGVLLWSLATIASGLARTFPELLVARACIGVGEAGYAAVAPSFIADLFNAKSRGRMLSIFYAALPIGIGIGYGVGGYVGTHYGWRHAFHVVAIPGLILGGIAFLLKEPVRGSNDTGAHASSEKRSVLETFKVLFTTPSYVVNTLGTTAMTFAMGGLAAWMPTFLNRERGIALDVASGTFGALLIVGGFAGTLAGGWLGDRLHARNRGGYFLSSGIGLLLGVPAAELAVISDAPAIYWPAIFVALFFLFFNTGPLNAALVNVVPANTRATAVAMNVLIIHMLGDALSPPLIGRISDQYSLGTAVKVNSGVIALAGMIFLFGARVLKRDLDRIEGSASAR
ncbi:MAG: spinster family MFS transporter [Myxococcaceae bacterium]